MRAAAEEYGWNLNYGGIALMWRGGCIIRSVFLGKIKEAFDKRPEPGEPAARPVLQGRGRKAQAAWRRVVHQGRRAGHPVPAFSSALAYYDGYRSGRLPANLLQAQRDYFGAHTYERVDKPRGEFFHTNWTGTDLRSRHIDYEGAEVEQGGPWGYRHQINIADSGCGSRGPRVTNDRAGEVGRTLNVKDFDLERIFGEDGRPDRPPFRPDRRPVPGDRHLLPRARTGGEETRHPDQFRPQSPRLLLGQPGRGTQRHLRRNRGTLRCPRRQRGGLPARPGIRRSRSRRRGAPGQAGRLQGA
jgi:hypothetical protein